MKKTHLAITQGGTALGRYQDVVVGSKSFRALIYFEFCIWLSVLPGAVGLFFRKLFWPRLFRSCGRGVNFGSNIILRHPNNIVIGDRVVLSEGCILDARSINSDIAISIGDDVIFSNNVMISCKNGKIEIGSRTGINAQSIIQSTNNCPVSIGSDVIVGPRCYIVGGGNYNIDKLDIPIWKQGIKNDGGLVIENDVWIGANVTVLGGVKIETGSIGAAGAVITKSISSRSICGGVPASIISKRK